MNKFISFFLKKYISSPKKEWLRLDSIFMVAGIIISVAVLTITLSLFDGYIKAMKHIYFGVNSHVYFFNRNDSDLDKELQDKLTSFLKEQPEVVTFAPIISNQVMISANGRIKGSYLRGINPQIKPQPTTFAEFVEKGSSDLTETNSIVIGEKIAKELNIAVNDTIKVISPLNSTTTQFGFMQHEQKFVVIGLYHSGMHEYDSKYAFCHIEVARTFFGYDDNVSMFEVKLADQYIEKADFLAYTWQHQLDLDYQTSSWIDFSGNLFSLLTLEKWVLFIILSFLVLIASFNVVSSVSSTILDKRRDLGIMKAFGTSNRVLRKILVGRIMIISFLAICLGQLLGYLISIIISKMDLFSLKGDVYFIDVLNVSFDPISWLIILTTSSLIVFFASLIPLKKIEKLPVTDILRGTGK